MSVSQYAQKATISLLSIFQGRGLVRKMSLLKKRAEGLLFPLSNDADVSMKTCTTLSTQDVEQPVLVERFSGRGREARAGTCAMKTFLTGVPVAQDVGGGRDHVLRGLLEGAAAPEAGRKLEQAPRQQARARSQRHAVPACTRPAVSFKRKDLGATPYISNDRQSPR